MQFLFLLVTTLAIAYFLAALGISILWTNKSEDEFMKVDGPDVSILIIVRNEEHSIGPCLNAIVSNDYPADKYEIIVIDDHSDDKTVEVVKKLNLPQVRLYHLSEFDLKNYPGMYKKAGQHYGVLFAQNEIILQTDGDCMVHPEWISSMAHYIKQFDIVTGPLLITSNNRFLERWQTFENIAVMAATYAGIKRNKWHNANGGNMCYKKDVFLNYKAHSQDKYASGDDLFLVNWASKNGYRIGFAKSRKLLVKTPAEITYKGFFNQRLRWATKTKGYNSSGMQWVMGAFFLSHLILVVLIVLSLTKSHIPGWPLALFVGLKMIGDGVVIHRAAPFYGMTYSWWFAPFFSLGHLVYILIFGIAGIFRNTYQWKGRSVH